MKPAGPAVPRAVRVAGVLVLLQGLAGLAFAGALLASSLNESKTPGAPGIGAATVVTLSLFAVIVTTEGLLLARGRRGARTPAIVTQLLLLGVSWYAFGPSSQPVYGISGAAYCVAILVLLFCPPALRWVSDSASWGHGDV